MFQLPWRKGKSTWPIPILSVLVFLLTGLALLPYPGLQNDELFFSGPIYSIDAAYYTLAIGGAKIPLMVMSYTGALKTWLYAGLFQLVAPDEWSVRLPMLLLGALTIWLTWCWVRRIAGVRAAAIATVLLATDTTFLLTNNFDWGPVALQHVLLMGGLLAVQKWLAEPQKWMLALGFFLWGLGMWDKALLIWPLIGLAVAAVCVFPRDLLARLRPVTITIAAASFLIGAAPLVVFNISQHGATATRNTKFTADGLAGKVAALRHTIQGDALYGYMVYEDGGADARAPRTRLERIAAWIDEHSGSHRAGWMLPASILALLCFVGLGFAGLWGSPAWRTLLFLLIVMALEWVQMAFTQGTGAPHHVILIWPFPLVFIGIAYSAMADRIPRFGIPAVALIVALLALVNLRTTNRYVVKFAENGGAGGWTDAIEPLADSVQKYSGHWIGLLDWGYLNQLRMLYEGDLQLFIADPADVKPVLSIDCVLIQHTEDKQIFPGVNDRFRQAVDALGYTEKVERVVHDRNGRPVYEIFRLQKTAP